MRSSLRAFDLEKFKSLALSLPGRGGGGAAGGGSLPILLVVDNSGGLVANDLAWENLLIEEGYSYEIMDKDSGVLAAANTGEYSFIVRACSLTAAVMPGLSSPTTFPIPIVSNTAVDGDALDLNNSVKAGGSGVAGMEVNSLLSPITDGYSVGSDIVFSDGNMMDVISQVSSNPNAVHVMKRTGLAGYVTLSVDSVLKNVRIGYSATGLNAAGKEIFNRVLTWVTLEE